MLLDNQIYISSIDELLCNETIEIFIVLLFLYTVFPTALSKTVGNILFVARMSGARSHGLFIHFGTQGFPLHSLQYQRRPYSTRCAKRLLHRSVRLILSCYYSLYPQCHILKLKSILIFRQAYTSCKRIFYFSQSINVPRKIFP